MSYLVVLRRSSSKKLLTSTKRRLFTYFLIQRVLDQTFRGVLSFKFKGRAITSITSIRRTRMLLKEVRVGTFSLDLIELVLPLSLVLDVKPQKRHSWSALKFSFLFLPPALHCQIFYILIFNTFTWTRWIFIRTAAYTAFYRPDVASKSGWRVQLFLQFLLFKNYLVFHLSVWFSRYQ